MVLKRHEVILSDRSLSIVPVLVGATFRATSVFVACPPRSVSHSRYMALPLEVLPRPTVEARFLVAFADALPFRVARAARTSVETALQSW